MCVAAAVAKGGATDATGYIDQCYDRQPAGTPTPVEVRSGVTAAGINAALGAAGAVSGMVTDADLNPLVDVQVEVYSPSSNTSGVVLTATDGSYTVSSLAVGSDYQVCFFASLASGGANDATGYMDQCYNAQPTGSPSPVTVNVGGNTSGIDAALIRAGAVSGIVTDVAHNGLAGVTVDVYSPSAGTWSAVTAADGSYAATGLPAGSDYQVCFYATYASGGTSDAAGYIDQCYDNQPTSGTPASVPVTVGHVTPGINAALSGNP